MAEDTSIIMIRSATAADTEGYHACLASVARERKYIGFIEPPPLENSAAWLKDCIERGLPFMVAVDGERVVGWCDVGASTRPGFTHVGVLGMGLQETHRGRGVGTRLLHSAIEAARQLGLEKLSLEVYGSNEIAIHLYEKAGFRHEGRKSRARKLDGIYEDIVIMGLFL